MDGKERKAFWDALCSIRDNTPESIQKIDNTIKLPEYLCRFRPVNENTLIQLQENKLYYSSADHYDDPFDTYIHVNFELIKTIYSSLSKCLESDNRDFREIIKTLEPLLGMSSELFLESLREHPLDLSSLPDRIKQIRTIIQKKLFSICFCDNALNETLWLKYANNYKGFALVYDFHDSNTFLCGKEDICKNCRSVIEKPTLYPVYYSEEAHDATQFALACLLWEERGKIPPQMFETSKCFVMWEAERISLIKKICYEYDGEWRMIRPSMTPERTCIKMKPYKIILGLKMPEYERLLVISAAKVAGISTIEELYIDDSDQLSSRILLQN